MAEQLEKVLVPDLGGAADVEVIEIAVKPGDTVAVEDALITLEGDKASMDVPSPKAGVVAEINVKVGDKISEGALILTLEAEGATKSDTASEQPEDATAKTASAKESDSAEPKQQTTQSDPATSSVKEVKIPDIGGASDVDVIEVSVKPGDQVAADEALITLEGDKASMDVPAPFAGEVTEVKLKVGDKASEGDVILLMKTAGDASKPSEAKSDKPAAAPAKATQTKPTATKESTSNDDIHAGPAVRRTAREVGIDLTKIKGSGAKGRITKDDIKNYVKGKIQQADNGGFGLPPAPKIDFTKFGEVETQPLSKIKKISGKGLHRNWVSIPHVTQFGEADITEMEAFRQSQKEAAQQQNIKLTPLVFIMKAVVATLKEFPIFNASLDESGENIILKKYVHIGVAVDTPNGLVVPVIRDVDKKGLFDLANELGAISKKAREAGLGLADMQGGCFTISSLGGIGGTAFTPIINAPEVSILGVSRSEMKPVYQKSSNEFVPRLMLPLSLSYDHRVVDGADGARFMVSLTKRLADIRTILL